MGIPVKLYEVVDALEEQSDETEAYLNKKTGQIAFVSSEEKSAVEEGEDLDDYPEWQQEIIKTAREIQETDDYIQLPSKFDVNDYRTMERFCYNVDDERKQEKLLRAISGKGAFRYFKDCLHEFDLVDDWYKFRNEALKQIAIEWCESNKIEFVDVERGS